MVFCFRQYLTLRRCSDQLFATSLTGGKTKPVDNTE